MEVDKCSSNTSDCYIHEVVHESNNLYDTDLGSVQHWFTSVSYSVIPRNAAREQTFREVSVIFGIPRHLIQSMNSSASPERQTASGRPTYPGKSYRVHTSAWEPRPAIMFTRKPSTCAAVCTDPRTEWIRTSGTVDQPVHPSNTSLRRLINYSAAEHRVKCYLNARRAPDSELFLLHVVTW